MPFAVIFPEIGFFTLSTELVISASMLLAYSNARLVFRSLQFFKTVHVTQALFTFNGAIDKGDIFGVPT